MTLPNETHSTGNKPEERGVLYWMNLRLPQTGSFLELPSEDGSALARKLTSLPQRHFAGSPAMHTILEDIFLATEQSTSWLRRLSVRNSLIRYLLEVITSAQVERAPRLSKIIENIASHVRSQPEDNYDLKELASHAGLSLSRFKARFKSEMGTSPRDFILRTKIDAALDRLPKGKETITEVAFRYGFSSSQYFATVFKRYTGQTPLEFRLTGLRTHLRDVGQD